MIIFNLVMSDIPIFFMSLIKVHVKAYKRVSWGEVNGNNNIIWVR